MVFMEIIWRAGGPESLNYSPTSIGLGGGFGGGDGGGGGCGGGWGGGCWDVHNSIIDTILIILY